MPQTFLTDCWTTALLLFGVLAGGLAACSDEDAKTAEALRVSRTAYENTLAETPDSVLEAMDPLDSLFLDHDLPALAFESPDSARAARWVDSVMAALSVEEKIGQLFIVHLPQNKLRTLLDNAAMEAVEKYHVGGFLVPRLLGPREVFERTQRLQQAAAVPLFFAADYERGAGRFSNALTELPSNMALGATRDTLLASAAGRLTALESRAIGVNLLLAPVVDVNNNPANPIINIRSYGEDPALVARMAAAFVDEAQRYGVLTTLKHFPGHGNTSVDSHARMGVVAGDAVALDSVELRPYRRVFDGASAPAGVMSAHLWVPALDAEPLPATFSRNALRSLLRDSLGFEGFIVTDDIRMGGLGETYRTEQRIVRPLQAGADLILTPASLPRAIQAVRAALDRGTLSPERLDGAVRRLLTAKARAGLHRQALADEATLDYLLEKPRGAYLAQVIADRAVTLLKTHPALPLRPATQRIALVQLSNTRDAASIDAAMDFFAEILVPEADVRLGRQPTRVDTDTALRAADSSDVVVVALYQRLHAGRGKAGLFPRQEQFVRALLARPAPVVLVTLGNPYAVTAFADAEALVVAYDQALETIAAVAALVQGLQPAFGTLPISVAPYAYGSGLPHIAAPE